MHLQNEIRKFFEHNAKDRLKFRMVHDSCKLENIFQVKERQELLHRSNVIYHVACSCGNTYIGETARNLVTRLNEHNPGSKKCKHTDVSDHLYKNSNHNVDFANPKILATARNRTKLLILETVKIYKINPEINVDQLSIPLYLLTFKLFTAKCYTH